MRGQLYHGHTNATALSSSPVVSALGSESWLGQGFVPLRLAGKKKKLRTPLLGLAKSIYYFIKVKNFFFFQTRS